MNATKIKIYKQVLKDICTKYPGPEEHIKERIEELRSHQKLSVEEVTYVWYLCFAVIFF